MKKKMFLFCFLAIGFTAVAQKQVKEKKSQAKTVDSTLTKVLDDLKDNTAANTPTISLDDNDIADGTSQNVSSVLTAGRDPFNSAAAYNFGAVRFRVRGYESDLFGTYMNGIPMDNLDNGFTPFGLWGGLNDVTRNKDVSIGLRANTFSFGDIGNVTSIDTRAIKQRKQTEIGYAFSNRNYTHKTDITHSSGINKKGWAYSFSASRRYAAEGYFPGTYYDGWSWFAAVDKRINQNHLLSLAAFYAPTSVGRQGTATKEAFDLAGTNYNPNWGWQDGKKRNAAVTKTTQPVFILTHDWKMNNSTSLVTAAGYSFGDRGSSGIDWYKADNPSPIYYRYLPSYWDDKGIKDQLTKAWQTDDNARQLNWTRFYQGNKASVETNNGVTGHRSRYILSERVTNTQKFNLNTVLNTRLGANAEFTAGASFQYQKNNNYRKAIDLLGGDYWLDVNQFAERVNPSDPTLPQADLNNPNRVVRKGDAYGYNYDIAIMKGAAWSQVVVKYNNVDYFAALEISRTNFYRKGNYKNGLFPTSSYGKSTEQQFNNFAFKTGFTYKLNGRNYLFGNIGLIRKAPFYDNVYLSPNVRNTVQNKVTSEDINTVEGGYTLNAPKIKVRLTGYYTEFKNQMNVMSFFHDAYLNFVNYGITGINKTHEGGELGIEAKVLPNLTVNGAAAFGRYFYTSNQNATTTIDNDASVVANDVVYAKDYYVGGTPQQAYSIGATYRSPKFWTVSLTYNYFDDIYVELNPIKRTESTVQGYQIGDPIRKLILDQTRLQSQTTLDFYGSYSLRLPTSYNVGGRRSFLAFSLSVSNLLNNKTIIPFMFEQLRYDGAELDKFPNKYNHSYGINYSASVAFRF